MGMEMGMEMGQGLEMGTGYAGMTAGDGGPPANNNAK